MSSRLERGGNKKHSEETGTIYDWLAKLVLNQGAMEGHTSHDHRMGYFFQNITVFTLEPSLFADSDEVDRNVEKS